MSRSRALCPFDLEAGLLTVPGHDGAPLWKARLAVKLCRRRQSRQHGGRHFWADRCHAPTISRIPSFISCK